MNNELTDVAHRWHKSKMQSLINKVGPNQINFTGSISETFMFMESFDLNLVLEDPKPRKHTIGIIQTHGKDYMNCMISVDYL
jgi:hypothetical protein